MRRLALVFLVGLVVTSCGGVTTLPNPTATESTEAKAFPDSKIADIDVAAPPVIESPLEEHLYLGFDGGGESAHTLVAISLGELDIYESPEAADPVRRLPATTILGTATVVTALGEPTDGWLEVMLPGRPNGSTGWVETHRVDMYMVTDRVVIDLSDRELTYYQEGDQHLTTTVAIGTSHNPTPTGVFFVTDLVDIPGGGPWGPAALGLSARSDTITEFNGGDGIIGIHGTNKPSSIGQAASLGCIRLPNDLIVELRNLVSLGTPVEIRA